MRSSEKKQNRVRTHQSFWYALNGPEFDSWDSPLVWAERHWNTAEPTTTSDLLRTNVLILICLYLSYVT